MQANTITINTVAYEREVEETNRTEYHSPSHTVVARDTMAFSRQAVKPTKEIRGIVRSNLKFTMDVSVLNADGSGNITLPIIVSTDFAIPVGAVEADIDSVVADMAAALADSAIANLWKKQSI